MSRSFGLGFAASRFAALGFAALGFAAPRVAGWGRPRLRRSRSGAAFAALAFFLAVGFAARLGLADDEYSNPRSYSRYEKDTLKDALVATKTEVDPSPEGKIIDDIILRRLDVFEKRDPIPNFLVTFLDWFHTTSKPFTIEREVLLARGEPYRQELVDESARNLRSVRQLSLVLCVPVKAKEPGHVKLLVITKDIWSLRLNSDIRATGQGLEHLLIQPSEENLGGLHHSASLLFSLDPATYTFGFGYKIPRILDSRIATSIFANFIVNRHTGKFEGSYGTLSYGQPLYSTKAKWAWGADARWLTDISRRFIGVKERTFDSKLTPEKDAIPYEFKTDDIAAEYFVTRSFGTVNKHDFTTGVEARRAAYRLPVLTGVDPRAVRDFQDQVMPVSDTRIYPFLQYETYSTRFMSVLDMNTLGLQEDYRLGHDAFVKVYPVTEALGSSRTYFGGTAGASYTVRLGDGLARAYASGTVEANGRRVFDASIEGGLRLVSPKFVIGRLVVDGLVLERPANFLNARTSLGGGGRLRGYPSGAFIGENFLAYNVEFRTRALELWTIQTGAVLFYDTGAAFDRGQFPDLKHSVGVGLRVLFPQLDRSTFRLDWGFPLSKAPELGIEKPFPGDVVFTFGQAFPMPGVAPPSVTD